MAKHQEIAELLRQRLRNGEYPGGKLPALRKIAVDMGVSYLTARHAVQTLREAGWDETRAARPLVAMVAPLWSFTQWHRAVRSETLALGGQIRFISYSSETDPVISEAINGDFDLIFLTLPDREDPRMLDLILRNRDRIVVMFRDLQEYGVRCIEGADPCSIEGFLELLAGRGYRRIDAFGRDCDIRNSSARYEVWREWLNRHQLEGELHLIRHEAFEPDDRTAAEVSRGLLDAGKIGDAVFCFMPSLAIGLYRACFERGIVPGRDISVFSFGEPGPAQLMTPALATVLNVGIPEMIRSIISEYVPGGRRTSTLRFTLKGIGIFEGESLTEPKGMKS